MTSSELCAVAGISFRRLDYWARAGHIPAATGRISDTGSGVRRQWTPRDAAFVVALARLVNAGVQLPVAAARLRRTVESGADLTRVDSIALSADVVAVTRRGVGVPS